MARHPLPDISNLARPRGHLPKGWKDFNPIETHLITPMFGGGVTTGEIDQVTPISAKAIRGQLRFWWRATRGATSCHSVQELSERETELFGSDTIASSVSILTEVRGQYKLQSCARYENRPRPVWQGPFSGRDNPLCYLAFPFQGSVDRKKPSDPAVMMTELTFAIHVSCHTSIEQDIRAALWAWINFGGIASCTRRGFGGLYAPDFSPKSSKDLRPWFRENIKNYGLDLSIRRDWPTLTNDVFFKDTEAHPWNAWRISAQEFFDFRQGVSGKGSGVGRNSGSLSENSNRPGRSHWPEPETIRNATGSRAPRHHPLSFIPSNGFPRAEFGLPIVFHFVSPPPGNPQDTYLLPVVAGARKDRMGSPLIIKPLAMSAEQAVPLILKLNCPSPEGVELVYRPNDTTAISSYDLTDIRHPRFTSYTNSPLHGSPSGSAIEGFLQFIQSHNFKKVGT